MTDDPDSEISAMAAIAKAMLPLDPPARRRVIAWVVARFPEAATETADRIGLGGGRSSSAVEPSIPSTVEARNPATSDFPDFFHSAAPSTEAEMALVAGYWLQNIQGQSDIDTQSANSLLKDLGRQLGNITRAFDALQTTEPRLVNQTKKIGSTRQGRKRFRLTDAGLRKVQAMVSSPESIGR